MKKAGKKCKFGFKKGTKVCRKTRVTKRKKSSGLSGCGCGG